MAYLDTKTVGTGKDYSTVGAAVEYWWGQLGNLSADNRGKILIIEGDGGGPGGKYAERLTNPYGDYGNDDASGTGYLIPPHVDIYGDGTPTISITPNDGEDNIGVVQVLGDNHFENVNIEALGVQSTPAICWLNSMYGGTVYRVGFESCSLTGTHGAIQGYGELYLNHCTVDGRFTSIANGYNNDIVIKNTDITQRVHGSQSETNDAICVQGNAIIDNVTITCDGEEGTYDHDGWWVGGIRCLGYSEGKRDVKVSNVIINMDFTVKNGSNYMYLFGISNDRMWTYGPGNSYRSNIDISDVTINLAGTEEAGADGMRVVGISSQQGGSITLNSNVKIITARTGSGGDGYNRSIDNASGTVKVRQLNGVDWDARLENGTITKTQYLVM